MKLVHWHLFDISGNDKLKYGGRRLRWFKNWSACITPNIHISLILEDLMVMRRWRMTTRTMAKTRARVRTRKSRRSRRRSRRTRMTRMTMGNGKLANQMNVADQINFYLKYISN